MEIQNQIIDILLKDHDRAHTDYQIERFIVGSEIHPWHRYKQALQEIASRRDVLIDQNENLVFLDSEITRLKLKSRFLFRRKRKIRLARKMRRRKRLVEDIRNNRRELDCFVRVAVDIRKTHGFEHLTIEQKRHLEAEAWREKAKWLLCMDLFCAGHPSKITMEFIYKLPKSVKRDLIISLKELDKSKVVNYLVE